VFVSCAVFALAITLNAFPCLAVSLPAGSAVSLLIPSEADPAVAGALQGTTGSVVFSTVSYSGTLTSNVYNNDPDNPNGLGALTFTYEIHNDLSSVHVLHRLTVSSFTDFSTNVAYSLTAGDVQPTFADSSPATGDVIGFNFPTPVPFLFTGPGPIPPGFDSAVLIVRTDATVFKHTQASVIDGTTTMVDSLAPRELIPEPSSLTLAAIGMAFALVAAWRRRHRGAR
jgi:hypothetical protein